MKVRIAQVSSKRTVEFSLTTEFYHDSDPHELCYPNWGPFAPGF
jgi:hypothetical protein